ncbi:helix-turn-helix transcriptional regulator [Metasolibacillus meyeri]|uniref:Helix-turn-helix transcriptional regulator n=1 Tax=Metasolibacillus meyeri TaxID=1071052 RepID=A0AAW9NPU1_9BACL|nr:helix-turn-helix transcriptional regulator [Metasolibacillus meyeri]MEC1178506.1 helix-turn-helix transcriptional regulator [Metasolibacillus meyeri]
MNEIGQRIKDLRKQRNIKAIELANTIGVSQGNISDWESDKKKSTPTSKSLIAIANFFDVSLDWLMTGEDRSPQLSDDEQKLLLFFRQTILNDKHEDNTLDEDFRLIQKLLLLNDRQKGIIEGRIDSLLEAVESKQTSSILIEGEDVATDETA